VIHRLTRDFGTVTRVWARRATRVRFPLLEAAAQQTLLPLPLPLPLLLLLQLACARRLQCRPKVDEIREQAQAANATRSSVSRRVPLSLSLSFFFSVSVSCSFAARLISESQIFSVRRIIDETFSRFVRA